MKFIFFLVLSLAVAVLLTPLIGWYAWVAGLLCLICLKARFGS
jgi:hypothetical protein